MFAFVLCVGDCVLVLSLLVPFFLQGSCLKGLADVSSGCSGQAAAAAPLPLPALLPRPATSSPPPPPPRRSFAFGRRAHRPPSALALSDQPHYTTLHNTPTHTRAHAAHTRQRTTQRKSLPTSPTSQRNHRKFKTGQQQQRHTHTQQQQQHTHTCAPPHTTSSTRMEEQALTVSVAVWLVLFGSACSCRPLFPMLSLTREYRLLLRYGGNSLYLTHPKDLPPVPLAPFEYTLLGRLSSLQCLADHGYLLSNIKSVAVKTALKKCQQPPQVSANPSGVISAAAAERALQTHRQRTPEELEAVARAASNPPWMPELVQSMLDNPDRPCRYIIVEDLLHPNSISRFHLIVKRQAIQPQQQQQQHAAAASAPTTPSLAASSSSVKIEAAAEKPASAPAGVTVKKEQTDSASTQPQPQSSASASAAAAGPTAAPVAPVQYRYWIKDLGSLNGLYIDGVKIAHQHWTLLHEGARLRFAPQTRNAKNYIASFQAADAVNEQRRRASAPGAAFPLAIPALPTMPLSVKDMHIEYIFSSAMNDACKQRVATLDTTVPNKSSNEDQDTRPNALYGFKPQGATAAAAAAAGLPSDYQSSASLARQPAAFPSYALPSTAAAAAAAASGVHMRDEEWNVAPLPSNYQPFNNSAASRKRARDNEEEAAAAAAPAAAAGVDNASDSAAKRARASAQASSSVSSPAAPAAASPASAVKCESDDEDMPLAAMRPSVPIASSAAAAAASSQSHVAAASSSAAAAASSSSSSSAAFATATSTSATTTTNSMMEELTCAICSDVIYQCVVLGETHSRTHKRTQAFDLTRLDSMLSSRSLVHSLRLCVCLLDCGHSFCKSWSATESVCRMHRSRCCSDAWQRQCASTHHFRCVLCLSTLLSFAASVLGSARRSCVQFAAPSTKASLMLCARRTTSSRSW